MGKKDKKRKKKRKAKNSTRSKRRKNKRQTDRTSQHPRKDVEQRPHKNAPWSLERLVVELKGDDVDARATVLAALDLSGRTDLVIDALNILVGLRVRHDYKRLLRNNRKLIEFCIEQNQGRLPKFNRLHDLVIQAKESLQIEDETVTTYVSASLSALSDEGSANAIGDGWKQTRRKAVEIYENVRSLIGDD